ncbi:CARDB domain-containing protein [Paenibacillus allorhizosphaerae]|uniref:CARDB domain-containing protein n=1 Tax=Paenibacillus allorhizosphaerae TaxID=2849866 RepID=A0ABN7TQ23_9BACL|nr:CARDB domain-containing protein [Paenibacillus allorhizosphaerae]CAG7646098.1 hypothetical protein PAECIP111802_03658 [Paenibacillus allorhizosphaerae]
MKRFFLVRLMLMLVILEMMLPFIPPKTYAASSSTFYIDFSKDGEVSTSDIADDFYSSSSSWSKSIDFSSHVAGVITGAVLDLKSGSGNVTFIDTKISVNIAGQKKKVYGQNKTNPGHQIYRLPDGKRWEHKGSETAIYQFVDPLAVEGGVSVYPGKIPNSGYIRSVGNANAENTTIPYDKGSPYFGNDLRYIPNPTAPLPSKSLGDMAPNWNMIGAAVTRSYDVRPPTEFYATESEATNQNGIEVDYVISSEKLVHASDIATGKIEAFAWGNVGGKNQVAVRRMLCEDDSLGNCSSDVSASEYIDETEYDDPRKDHSQLRNYVMEVYTDWEADSYTYRGSVTVTYELPSTPDLAVLYIKANKACIEVGDTVIISYAFKNIGVDTPTPFDVQLKIDGVIVKSDPATSANTGILLGGTYSYTFSTSAPKDFTLVVDPEMSINDSNRSNNTISETFSPQSSCGGGGDPDPGGGGTMTGTLTIQKDYIPWKDDNLFLATVDEKGCTLEKFKWNMKGNGGSVTVPSTGWYPNNNHESQAGYIWKFDTALRMYPGNIQDGTVTVSFIALDSCGNESTIGPKSFVIGPPPPNTPPELRITFIDPTDGSETGQVIAGDRVDMKITRLFDADGDPLTLQWLFTGDTPTDWIKRLPAKHGWTSPFNKMSYTGMTADVVGLQLVCAVASDGVKSTQSCANLNVIPPNPIPKINGPQVIKVNRPVNPPWDSSQSYSPVKGRTINHSRDEWTNALTKYTMVGEHTISLNVFDNTGLKSLNPDTWKLTVIPDQPPVIDFLYSGTISRVAPNYFKNNSRSPDGDTIVKYETWYGYDANNNGSCNPYENLISTDNNNFAFHPSKIGKYCFRLYAEEDYGLSSWKDYIVEVTNDNPEVSFMVSGQTNEPVPVTTVPLPTSSLLGNSWVNTSLDKYVMNKQMWILTPDGTLSTTPRLKSTSIGMRLPMYTGETTIYNQTSNDPNLTYPHSQSSISYVGSLGFIQGASPGVNAFNSKNPVYYLGDNMFIYQLFGWGSNFKIEFYLAAPHLPNPILIYQGQYDGYGTVIVREDLDEIILQNKTESFNSYVGLEYKRYKISNLKAGNTVADYSFKQTFTINNREYPDWGAYVKFSDSRTGDFLDQLIKTTSGYVRINLSTRVVEYYTLDNIITPYKTETYTDIPAMYNSGTWNSGVFYPTYEYFREGFRTPGGNIFDKHGESALIYYWDDKDRKLKAFDPNKQLSGPGTKWHSGTLPHAISPDENYIMYYESSSYSPDLYIGNLTTGEIGVKSCGEVGGYPDYDNLDDEGNPGWVSGDWVCSFGPAYIPPDQLQALENYVPANANGYIREPIDGYTPIYKYDGSIWPYSGHWWLGNAKTEQHLWNIGQSCPDQIPKIYAPGVMVMCGKLYNFPHADTHLPESKEYFTYGQLINSSQQPLVNGTLKWSMRINHLKYDYVPAGMSFRIQDNRNMYRIESMKDRLRLIKIVNGEKTLLAESLRYLPSGAWAAYSVKLTGNEIKVYQNGTPLFTVYDNTFATGTYGPYSVHETTEFKEMAVVLTSPQLVTKTYGAAVVDTTVNYETTYEDPENDPRFDNGTQWRYTHVDPFMFLDVGDGKSGWSSKNGALVTTPIMSFDKVGKYNVEYRAPDDPHPNHRLSNGDTSFQGYSGYSNWYLQPLIVHRAPIVNFTVTPTASNTLQWTDISYDPDHCYNASSCQNGYQTDRGIKFEKYYYITPSGYTVNGKLVHPAEPGTYTVAKAVGDEYYAWSDWMEQTVTINCSPCVANTPPTVSLTFPNGGYTNPSPVTLRPTITWNQGDVDPGTIFTVFDIEIKDIWGNCYECIYNRSMNTTNTSWAWTMDTALQMGGQYQVRVRVSDGEAFSEWSNVGWMITNRAPVTFMSFPYGTQANPTYITTTRPQFQWSQTDPDPGTTFTYFQLQVANAANGVILDTGNVWQGTTSTSGSYTPGVDMPTNEPLRVRVQATDGFAWSGFSPDAWMVINRPPAVTLTFPYGTQTSPNIIASSMPTITWNQSDPDPGTMFTYFQVQIANETNHIVLDSGKLWQGITAGSGSWNVTSGLPAGQKLRVRVMVWDAYGAQSEWSAEGWLYINRAPIGNLTYTVPIYENDTPTFTLTATDPDGDVLAISIESSLNGSGYTVIKQWTDVPSGQTTMFTYGPLAKGTYTLRMTLDDGRGGTFEQTYSYTVLPLGITGWVNHTAEWESYRQQWNSDHPGQQRAASDFWAGEAFVLAASVTDTGTSATKPVSVTSTLLTSSETVTLSSNGHIDFTGRLLNVDHDRLLKDGAHTFRFVVHWSNGLVQNVDVPIMIKGSIWDVIVPQIRH